MKQTVHARPNVRLSSKSGIRRTVFDLIALFAMTIAAFFIAAVFGMQYWYAERIYPGIAVEGVPVGGLTRTQAINQLDRTLVRQPLPPILVTHDDTQWPIAAGQAVASVDTFDAVHRAYMIGRDGGLLQRFQAQMDAALGAVNVEAVARLDVPQLRYAISQVASDIRVPARPGIIVEGVEIPPQPGLDVDVDETLSRLVAALEIDNGNTQGTTVTIPLAVVALEPPPQAKAVTLSDETDPYGRLTKPLLLRDPRFGFEAAIDPATLNAMVFARQPLRLDDEQIRRMLQEWAAQIDIEPLNARLRFDSVNSVVEVVQNSQMGRELDVEGTLSSINQAITDGSMRGELVIRDRLPTVDSRYVDQMGIRELVASGTTYFAGSSAARVRNIEVAAEKFEGVVVPPNGTFSFNENVEDVTAANGFEDSLIIWGDRTAVGVGGGVCQVSTTVFRAAFQAGLPIVERYNHGYVVGWYGDPGQDATIYTPSVDFKFRNDTGAYLLLEPVVDTVNGSITFNFYGTKPDRTVNISEPEISDIVKPAAPIYRYDETLGYGEKEQVDWAQDGMVAEVTRTIIEGGETRTEVLRSEYQPWQAVYLYGPGTVVPVTPTPQPRTDSITSTVESELDGSLQDANGESGAQSETRDGSDGPVNEVVEQLLAPTVTPEPAPPSIAPTTAVTATTG